MEISEAILHRIEKQRNVRGPGAATTLKRETLLPIDDRLARTVSEILRIYTKSTSGYGTFDTNQTVYVFPMLLGGYVGGTREFIEFSQQATELVAARMGDELLATGGYALFLRYTSQERDWMLVAMLKLKPGTGVVEDTLELNDTLSFDIDHLHEAARVDIAKWQANTHPYLSFIKKRQGGEDVSHYFRNALGCTEYTDSKHNTQKMQEAVEAYCSDKQWDYERKRQARQTVYEYCAEKEKRGEPVVLTSLSAIIDDQEPEAFKDFVRDKGYEVSETFRPHKATFTKLKRITRSFGTVKLGFDVQDISEGRVGYDDDNDCLVIKNLPQELIAEIKKHQSGDNDTTE